jgi:hypothetical protein
VWAHWLKYRQRSLATVGKENGNGWRAQTEPIAPRQPAQAQEIALASSNDLLARAAWLAEKILKPEAHVAPLSTPLRMPPK